jgi:hypothetical protein
VNRRVRRTAVAFAVLATGVVGPTVSASAAPDQAQPTDQLLSIVSPLAAPVCSAVGSTTFLVPVVGGLLNDQLALDGFDAADTLLDVLGPLFVVCGSLPGAKGTRCELDSQIAGVYPADLKTLLPPPTILGGIIEGLDTLLETLGVPPSTLGLASVFMCAVPDAAAAPTAPAAPPAAPITTPATSTVFPAPLPAGASIALPDVVTPSMPRGEVAAPARTTLISRVIRDIPDWVSTVQLILVAMLAAYLGSSWMTSARIVRRRPKR